jgi:uncharacterized protein YegL
MTKRTEIVFILDKSGSMQSIKSDAIGGFNAFVEEQLKGEGETNVTLVLFDTNIETLVGVHELTDATFKPSGLTALVDAIGTGIDQFNKVTSEKKPEEQPDNVIFAIMTDGHENASRQYTAEAVKNKIENMKNRDYQFLFLGANIDAVGTAKGLGISGDYAGGFEANGRGIQTAMLHASEMVMSYRSMGKMATYTDVANKTAESANDIAEALKSVNKAINKDDKGE